MIKAVSQYITFDSNELDGIRVVGKRSWKDFSWKEFSWKESNEVGKIFFS